MSSPFAINSSFRLENGQLVGSRDTPNPGVPRVPDNNERLTERYLQSCSNVGTPVPFSINTTTTPQQTDENQKEFFRMRTSPLIDISTENDALRDELKQAKQVWRDRSPTE